MSEEIPYKGQIAIGETISFLVNGVMLPLQVTAIGYNTVELTSLCLNYKWNDVAKSKFLKQRELLNSQ